MGSAVLCWMKESPSQVKAYPGAFVPPLTCESQIKVMMKTAPTAMMQHMKPVDNVTEIRRQALDEFLSRFEETLTRLHLIVVV